VKKKESVLVRMEEGTGMGTVFKGGWEVIIHLGKLKQEEV
jgi:hypothetical protein